MHSTPAQLSRALRFSSPYKNDGYSKSAKWPTHRLIPEDKQISTKAGVEDWGPRFPLHTPLCS